MKIRQKFNIGLALGGVGFALAVVALIYFALLPSIGELRNTGDLWAKSVYPPHWPIYWKLALFFVLLLCLACAANGMRVFRRRVLLPMYDATQFSYDLGNGKFPAPFVIDATKNAEMNELFKSLNIIRDRLISNANRLRSSHTREAEARRETENTAELKSMLISRMAPDMRVPLNSIAGYVELLSGEIGRLPGEERAESAAFAHGIRRNIKVLTGQIERLLKVGSIGQSNLQISFQTFDTAELLRAMVQQNEFLLSERSIKLQTPFSPSAPLRLRTDREMLLQMLTLMVRGVSRASESGELIRCFCATDRNQVEFHVCDSRKARSREKLAEMFNLARRDNNLGAIENASTTVLGMVFIDTQAAIVGGKLTAETNAQSQSEFILSFGVADIAAEQNSREQRTQTFHFTDNRQLDEEVFSASDDSADDAETEKNYRILLGEEDADNADVLTRILERGGFSVRCGSSATELLQFATLETFDAAILSNTMRHRNMVATIRKILHQSEQAHLPIMVLASKMSELKQNQLHSAGVRCVMMKPLDFPALLRRLRKLCRDREY